MPTDFPRPHSRAVTDGPERAPHRAFFRAMGLTDDDIQKPWVGVAAAWNEATPCNITLDRQAIAAAEGVKQAGGTPRRFHTISVSDGIGMGHQGMKASLVSREVIADSAELMFRAHGYDAFVGIAGCDKSLPGMLMAMARLNRPAVFLYGGTILPGELDGKKLTVQDVYEAVGAHSAGTIDDEQLRRVECAACPSAGSCGGQFTANTMATVAEAIGMALPMSGSPPAIDESRDDYARQCGEAVLRMLKDDVKPRRHHDEGSVRERDCSSGGHGRVYECRTTPPGPRIRVRHRTDPRRHRPRQPKDADHRRPQNPSAATPRSRSTRPAASPRS